MDFIKKLFENDSTVVGLCDLKRRQAVNSFNFTGQFNYNRPFTINPDAIGYAFAKL